MKISKEVILKIELVGNEVRHLKSALEDIMAAEDASNQGLGYLKRERTQSILNRNKQRVSCLKKERHKKILKKRFIRSSEMTYR
jgi:ElaB/YqjD/DUF883 family membrane-anchored ribosome-binding protein